MNVTEELLRTYLETFNRTYLESADALLEPNERALLYRYPLMRGGTIGYVSTQFGAAYEYRPSAPPGITIRRHSARIEDIVTDAPRQVRELPSMFAIGGHNISIGRLTLEGGFPFRLTNEQADLTLFDIRFRVGQWERIIEFAQVYGNRSSPFWSAQMAVARAKDEILQAVLQLARARQRSLGLAEYIDRFKAKTVLLLGDYSDSGRIRLEAIRDGLVALGYEPILLGDIPDRPEMDLQQKVVAVGSVSRFVVIDDSSRAGHILELGRVQDNRWVAIVLRLLGSDGTFMTRGIAAASTVILERTYTPDTLGAVLADAAAWAERKIGELEVAFSTTYPWRLPTPPVAGT